MDFPFKKVYFSLAHTGSGFSRTHICLNVACRFFVICKILLLYFHPKVCIIKNYTNSRADNSASRHDRLNLKGSAESGEKND